MNRKTPELKDTYIVVRPIREKKQPLGTYYYLLFKHMLDEHGLVLTDSELNEIARKVSECK